MPKVYYLAPDYDIPSWGIGMLYSHVKLLNKNGINARILHHKSPFRYNWFKSGVPISYLNDRELKITKEDYLVVPEVNVMDKELQCLKCKKIAFVQGPFLTLTKTEKAYDYSERGYDHVMVILPSIKEIVDTYFGAQAYIIPPFVAPYFFSDINQLNNNRKKRIIIFQNPAYGSFNYVDYDICSKILNRRFRCANRSFSKYLERGKDKDWEYLELKGFSHERVSEIMKESAFFINLNCLEGLNTTVAEAMAAGAINVCYEAYSPKDYLKDKENAYVFPNNYVYPLLNKLFELVERYDNMQDELDRIRKNAYKTALNYTEEETEKALLEFFRGMMD